MADLLYIASSEKEAKIMIPFTYRLHGNHWFVANGIGLAFELANFIKFDLVFVGDFRNIHLIKAIENELGHLPIVFEASINNQVIRSFPFTHHVTIYDKPLSSIDMMRALLFYGAGSKKQKRMIA
ncbi:MAG: hypothetical protein ACJAUV_000206 [Flavobacteriales bacterium]|jgi:hypothetical protein